ncbi:hypothetical protein ACQ4WX_00345 [Streptomyces lasalocidi]
MAVIIGVSPALSTCLILPHALKARRLGFPLTLPESVGQVDASGHLVAQGRDVGEEFEECVTVVGALPSRASERGRTGDIS